MDLPRAERPQRVRVVEDAIEVDVEASGVVLRLKKPRPLLDRLEHDVLFRDLRVVRKVEVEVARREREVPVAHVEHDRDAGGEVDDVDGVVREVVPVVLHSRADVVEIEERPGKEVGAGLAVERDLVIGA